MDELQTNTHRICTLYATTPNAVRAAVRDVGAEVQDRPDKGYLITTCPMCGGKASVRYKDSTKELAVFWSCFNKGCQAKAHSSLVGFIRAWREKDGRREHPSKTIEHLEEVLPRVVAQNERLGPEGERGPW